MAMMRVSNNMIYGQNMQRLSTLQAQLMKTQLHISGNTRILTPEDDPVAAARALDLKQGKSMNTQFGENRKTAESALKLQESTLGSVTEGIQRFQTLLVNAGDGINAQEQLRVIAEEMRSIRDEINGYTNTRDPMGDYIFSGHQTNVKPFDMSATGQVTWKGDSGKRELQIDAARVIAVANSGSDIFMGIKGTTASTVEATRNDFLIDVNIKDEAALKPGNYFKVTFTGTAPAAQYSLQEYDSTDTAVGAAVTGVYTGREKESLIVQRNGVEFSISGEVTNGDEVTITPGEVRRTDIFTYMNDAIDLLEASLTPNAASTNLALGLESLIGNFATVLDQVVTARSSAGTRLKELEALDSAGLDKDLQYTESISELEDLDYYKAISDLMQQQLALEAAQKTFMQINGLSLFNLM